MAKKLINTRTSEKYPTLEIRKYSKHVFFDNLWDVDPQLLESRGHVYNSEGKRVVNTFTKIFNYKERGTTIEPHHRVLYVRKVNGFMASATFISEIGEVVIATSGSFDGEYVEMAKHFLNNAAVEKVVQTHPDVTYMFEIVHPADPHIIPETPGAYLIGIRPVSYDEPYTSSPGWERIMDAEAIRMGVKRPEWFEGIFADVVEQSKTVQHEGFVVYDKESEEPKALKIKSPYYLTNKAAARIKDIETLSKTRVDEEYYPLLDHIKDHSAAFNSLDEQSRLVFIQEFLSSNTYNSLRG
jgi:hypothetical protein